MTRTTNKIGINLSSYLTTATASSTYGTITDLNTKQNTLIASTTILGIGSNITSLNCNNISNPPNLSQYALSTDLTNKQNTLTSSTTLLGIGSSITQLNYANISNPPTLNFLPLTGGNLTGNLTNTNNISIGTTNISSKLSVNNIVIDRNTYDHSLSPLTITHQTSTSSTVLNDPQPILNLCRQGSSGQSFGAKVTINLCRYENNSTNSRTRMDISLANGQYDNNDIITFLSSGNVGIGLTNPSYKLDVNGSFNSSGIINANGNSLVFPNTLSDFKITLYSGFGFGIQSSELKYTSAGNHKFYNGSTNTFTIDGSGNASCSTIDASGGNSFFSGLRLNGGDTGNTIYQPTGNLAISANTGYTIPFAIGNGNVITTISNSGMTFKDYRYITYPNAIYFQNTTANKTITMSAGNLNVPENINCAGYINLTSAVTSYLTFADKWKIGIATASGVANSLVFNHIDTGINSYWYFSGTQASTASEVSDKRIKKEIKDIETPLNKFMLLKPKEYYLCDDKDYNKKFGIIAQDVEVDFRELIYKDNEYIANICSYAVYSDFTITLDKDITDLISVDDELKILLDNNDKNNLEIAIDDTPYNNRYKRRFCKVVEIIDNHSFKIGIELKEENIFVFGKRVKDFKKLDYQSLYCLNIFATQELYKIIKDLQARIEILENR